MAYEKREVKAGDVMDPAWGNHIQTQYDEVMRQINGASIVEQDSNENGEYIRYDNGVQICWGAPFHQATTNLFSNGISYSETEYWTYPKPFNPNYPVTVNAVCAAISRICGTTGSTTVDNGTRVPIRTYALNGNKSDSPYLVSTFAIGRWK